MKDLNKIPYAKWLEEVLSSIMDLPVDSMYIVAKMDDGSMVPACYNCNVSDKLLFAGHIQQDAMIDTLKINRYIESVELDPPEDY